ncbi:MAG: DUF5615 family PIN-like protein [bacterium]
MKFLVVNALSPLLSKGLKQKGYDAIHVREVGMAAASDVEFFDIAAREDRILISADTDFGALLAVRESSKPTFILYRQSDKRPASQLKFLLAHLQKLEEELLSGCIVVFEDERIRSLPISKDS